MALVVERRDARTEESRREDRRVATRGQESRLWHRDEENRYNIILEVTVHIYR